MQIKKVLVVGATGKVGSEIAKNLISQGYFVRGTTKDKKLLNLKEKNFEYVYLDLETMEGLKEAFQDTDRAFFLSPAGYLDQYKLLSPLIREAKNKNLEKVVLMSVMGVNLIESSPLRRAEVELENSGLNYNIIRPNWFMQNFNTFWIQGIIELNKILLPAGDAKVSFIDSRDISDVATKLLTSNIHNNKAFDLTGPESITHDTVANYISSITNKKVFYQNISSSEFKKDLLNAELSEHYADFLVTIMGFLREGFNSKVTDSVSNILGRSAISISKYVNDYKKYWL